MRVGLLAVAWAFVLAGGSAMAQDSVKTQGVAAGAPVAGTAKPDVEIRRGNDADLRPAQPANLGALGASIPFPYTVATEPPREPYRRPVPCGTYARGTDGTTTCIGIEDRAAPGNRRFVAKSPRPATPPPVQIARRDMPEPRRELTDPRFHQPPPDFVPQPRQGGGGLLAFLGSVFSR